MAEVDDDPKRSANKNLVEMEKELNSFINLKIGSYKYEYLRYTGKNIKQVMDGIHSEFFNLERDIMIWLSEKMTAGSHYASGGLAGEENIESKYAFVNWGKPLIRWNLADVMKIKGILIGTDKLGHFFTEGYRYHEIFLKTGSLDKAKKYGDELEKGVYGLGTSGIYSNSDLSANLSGYYFYDNLYKSLVKFVPDQNNISKKERIEIINYIKKMKFDISKYINKDWNEFENPGLVDQTTRNALDKSGIRFQKDVKYYKETLYQP